MIGQTIELRRTFPLGAVLWSLAGLALDVLALASGNVHWAIASLLPWVLACLLLWRRERPFRAAFTETAVEVDDPPSSLPYAEMQGLLAGRRRSPNPFKAGPRSYPIQIIHDAGVVRVPARLNVPSDQVYTFLYNRFSSHGSRDVHPALADYLRYKERQFGADRVWSYRARRYRGIPAQFPRLAAFCLAVVLAGLTWGVIGTLRSEPGWGVGGFLGAFVFGLLAGLLALQSRPLAVPGKLCQASLVISPDGIALAQADMQGQLKWDEVRDVQYKPRVPYGFQISDRGQHQGAGIVIKVAGALIVILDVYDRPLPLIHQLIRYYWSGDSVREGAKKVWSFDAARAFAPEPARGGEGVTPGG
jgi:hypothetical protein